MGFPVLHGIKLAKNSAIENATLEVQNVAALTSTDNWDGRYVLDSASQKLAYYSNGQWVTVADSAALDALSTNLGAEYINRDGSVAMTSSLNMDSNRIEGVADPTGAADATNKGYVDNAIANLGSVFEYVGQIDPTTTTNQSALTQTDAGDYYTFTAAGTFTLSDGTALTVNAGDSIVFNAAGGANVFDNTNTVVSGTTGEVVVNGNTDSGFVVSIDPAFTASLNSSSTAAQAAQAELDVTQVGAGLNSDGSYTADAAASYINTATSMANADSLLDTQLRTITDYTGHLFNKDDGNNQTVDNVVTFNETVSFDYGFNGQIPSGLPAQLLGGTGSKLSLDTVILETNTNIKMTNGNGNMSGLTEANVMTAKETIELINNAMDMLTANKHIYTSSTPADTHTITPTLNGNMSFDSTWENSTVSVLVKNPDTGEWAHDIVELVWDSGFNTLTLSMSVARDVKVIIEKVPTTDTGETKWTLGTMLGHCTTTGHSVGGSMMDIWNNSDKTAIKQIWGMNVPAWT